MIETTALWALLRQFREEVRLREERIEQLESQLLVAQDIIERQARQVREACSKADRFTAAQ